MTLAVLACISTALLLLAAHAFHAGDWGLAAATIGTLPLRATRLAWVRIILAAAFSFLSSWPNAICQGPGRWKYGLLRSTL